MDVPPCSPDPAQKFGVSLGKLLSNLDMLLERDLRDCSTKKLTALMRMDHEIFRSDGEPARTAKGQNEQKCARHEKGTQMNRVGGDARWTKIRNMEVYLSSVENIRGSRAVSGNYSNCEASTEEGNTQLKDKDKCKQENEGKEVKTHKEILQEWLLGCSHDQHGENALPSNGWWRRSDSSESELSYETDEDAGNAARQSQESMRRQRGNPCRPNCREEGSPRRGRGDGRRSPDSVSCLRNPPSDQDKNSPIFHLTSFDNEDLSESLKSAGKHCSLISGSKERGHNDDVIDPSEVFGIRSEFGELSFFPDDLELECGSLFSCNSSVTSRAEHKPLSHRAQVRNQAIEKPQKTTNDSPEMPCARRPGEVCQEEFTEHGSDKKVVFVPFQRAKQRSPVGGRSGGAQPVKLKLKHRADTGGSRLCSQASCAARGANSDRLLPTTLTHSDKNSYSLMSPYMANVVWSVMKDENI